MTVQTVLVELTQMEIFQKRFDALNKKAVNFGLEKIKILSNEEVQYKREYNNGICSLVPSKGENQSPVLLKKIELEFPQIKLGNWNVIGKLEVFEENNLTFSISQKEDDVKALLKFANNPIKCEHCKINRYRKNSYILRNEYSEYKQIGSACLKDFVGIDVSASLFLANMSTLVENCEEDLERYISSGSVNAVNVRSYLANVSYISDNFGFISSTKAKANGLEATYDEAIRLEQKGSKDEKYIKEREIHLTKADIIKEWVLNNTDESTFIRNVKQLLQSEYIPLNRKYLAFVAASIAMYNSEITKQIEANKPSVHIGTLGQKMSIELEIHKIIQLDTMYGIMNLVLMNDKYGNKVLWKTSNPKGVKAGDIVNATFKVKEHTSYMNKAQTVVTHLKVA